MPGLSPTNSPMPPEFDAVFTEDKPKYNKDRDEVFARIGKGWHPVPNLFAIFHEIEEKIGGGDDSRRVPASFHKYLHILWREICFDRGPDWTAEMYDDQFNMRPSDAGKWRIALSESVLFHVRQIRHVKTLGAYGVWNSVGNRGPMSVYKYNTQATGLDWTQFYKALRAACAECPRPYKVAEWRVIIRRHVKANHAGVTDKTGAITRA